MTFSFVTRWDRFDCGCPFNQAILMIVAIISCWIYITTNLKGLGRADAGGDLLINMCLWSECKAIKCETIAFG